jgi:hypothetical protein
MQNLVNATSLPRLMNCGGSFVLDTSNERDNVQSDDLIEGNAAHKVVQTVIAERRRATDLIGVKVNNNFIVTDDMVDFLLPVIQTIERRNLLTATEYNTDWNVTAGWNISGRCDVFQFDYDTETVFIDDLKYGWRIVEPEMNWTLVSHAIGIAFKNNYPVSRAVLTIHQPRPFHKEGKSREWIIDRAQLIELNAAVVQRFNTFDNTLKTGPHCYKCGGLAVCPAARQAGLNAIDVAVSGYHENLDGVQLGYEMIMLERAADAIKQRLTALESLADSKLRKGEPVQGFALGNSVGKTRWHETATPAALQMLTGIKATEEKQLSPAAYKKAGAPEAIVDSMSYRPNTGMKLVKEDLDKKAKKLLGKK